MPRFITLCILRLFGKTVCSKVAYKVVSNKNSLKENNILDDKLQLTGKAAGLMFVTVILATFESGKFISYRQD